MVSARSKRPILESATVQLLERGESALPAACRLAVSPFRMQTTISSRLVTRGLLSFLQDWVSGLSLVCLMSLTWSHAYCFASHPPAVQSQAQIFPSSQQGDKLGVSYIVGPK